jgi:site-specific DNA recombinase
METIKRAVIYIRVSSKEQAADDKCSLENQLRVREAYIKAKGYTLVRAPYVDVQSGQDVVKDRGAFEQMLGDGSRGDYDAVVAWRPDRFFRGLWPAARLKRMMDATGVDAESATVPMDKSTLGLWAWVAEREIEGIRERTIVGREALARAGKLIAPNADYGFKYDKAKKHICHDRAEKPRVIFTFKWVADGKSITSLVTYLNEMGIPTRYGKAWRRQQVVKILRNPIYVGRGYWGKRQRKNGRAVGKRDIDQSILVPVEPIVPAELFDKVQAQLGQNRVLSPRNTKHIHLLQHLLYCRECGKTFHCKTRYRSHHLTLRVPQRYYGCRGMRNSPGAYRCRRPAEIRAELVEKAVWDKVAESFSQPEALLEMLRARNAAAAAEAEAIKADLRGAQDQLAKRDLELQQVLSWARQNLLSADELKPQLAQVREQKQHWEQETARLNTRLRSFEVSEQSLADAEQFCRSVRGRLGNLTPEKKKEFLRLVIERVWVDGQNNLDLEVIIPPRPKQPDVVCETAFS